MVVFIFELLIALFLYFLFRKLFGNKKLVLLAIGVSLIALLLGWTAGYRITNNTLTRDYRDIVKSQIQNAGDASLTQEKWVEMREKFQATPEYKYHAHKSAAYIALPGFVLVLIIMILKARKHNKFVKADGTT